ncbi:MAG: thioredoxin domain-containing protein [Gemmatimonadales bacterium]|nr:thioredoxin domain-containing protein [Gemmatimonadales bacterium]NIN11360.1 thioredoxin domain-containing protein [Gemmatimonadales bacterium]NIN49970.1 thioredoxin domain-containing protein [Gemmatimonadales bacterium]NIP07434.1 thioredoxin domain-containing protein [Gemmatimonadales bacterium]NIR00501.1 thioredoxin domain-containing protein [Gemmatimonadales bacterium]
MQRSLTLSGNTWPRVLSGLTGLGMIVASILTVRHFFLANYPTSLYEGSFCDISAFLNCDSSAYSVLAELGGVPLGYFGLVVGALVALGAVFPSTAFERTNKSIAVVNGVGVVGLFVFSVSALRSLCLLCSGYWILSLVSLGLFWRYGIDGDEPRWILRYFQPSPKYLSTFAVVTVAGAYGFALFHDARKDAQSGAVAARFVEQYFNLPEVELPSVISPFMTVQSTENFEDAPIRVIEYGDLLCPDCEYLNEQLELLKKEFAGKINVAFQFFPLDAQCNDVVAKDKHPGACDLSYMAAYDPSKFTAIHDEVFANLRAAKDPEWRRELARRYQVQAALTDTATKELVHRIINTGTEYEKTSDRYAHGIRSTPTMIVNNRMIIGTFPYEQLRAIFQALVDEEERGAKKKFLENWEQGSP